MSPVIADHLSQPKSAWARRVEAEFRVPIVGSLWPGVYWIACVVDDPDLHGTIRPTDDELRLVRSYIEFATRRFYNERYQATVLDDRLPCCAGHNTVILAKYPDVPPEGRTARGWGYKRMTWQTGSWPHAYLGARQPENLPDHPLTLTETLDAVTGYGAYPHKPSPEWDAWKAQEGF